MPRPSWPLAALVSSWALAACTAQPPRRAPLRLTADTTSLVWQDTGPAVLPPHMRAELSALFGWPPFGPPAATDSGSAEIRQWFDTETMPPLAALRIVATDSSLYTDRWVFWGAAPMPMRHGCWTKGPRPMDRPCSAAETAAADSQESRWYRRLGDVIAHGFRCSRVLSQGPFAACHLPQLAPESAAAAFHALDSLRLWNLAPPPPNPYVVDGMGMDLEMRVGSRYRILSFANPDVRTDSLSVRALGAIRVAHHALRSAARGGRWQFWERLFGAPAPRW
jgi:hypothetical protein